MSLTSEGRSTTVRPAPSSTVALICATLVLIAFFGVSVFYSLPSNALSTRDGGAARTVVVTLFPQGWAFFTRDPDSESIVAYTVHGDTLTSAMFTPQTRASNWSGLSRTQRAQGPELAFAAAASGNEAGSDCEGLLSDCAPVYLRLPPVQYSNTSPTPTVCGDIVLVRQQVPPWSFRSSGEEPRVSFGQHLDIRC